jgi:hypothetical protein
MNMAKKEKRSKHNKLVDETIILPIKDGNGILRYSLSENKKGQVVRYSFVYINPSFYGKDNGRVLGFDNSHGFHHCHRMGHIEKVVFHSYEEIVSRFEAEWRLLHEKVRQERKH